MKWIIVVMWAGGGTFGFDTAGGDRTYYDTLAECQEHGPAFAEKQGKFQGVPQVEWHCEKVEREPPKPFPEVHHRSDLDQK